MLKKNKGMLIYFMQLRQVGGVTQEMMVERKVEGSSQHTHFGWKLEQHHKGTGWLLCLGDPSGDRVEPRLGKTVSETRNKPTSLVQPCGYRI